MPVVPTPPTFSPTRRRNSPGCAAARSSGCARTPAQRQSILIRRWRSSQRERASPCRPSHARIGTAGNTVPLVTDWLRDSFAARVSGELILLGDVEIALDAAFHGGPGVFVLAGT